jgi:predicted GH43/DUF377 family glycosyl hydrolase
MIGLFVLIVLFNIVLVRLIYIYWERKNERLDPKKSLTLHSLEKFDKNPIISPQAHNEWEACGVFNPAAYKDDNHNVHLLYRAIGTDGVSRLGYAQSPDGVNFDERTSYPVFFIENPRNISKGMQRFDPVMYPSGGSWGGTEDPRLVRIGDTLYLTFNAFDGWDFIRIGLTSILEKDFLAGKWNWKKPILISPTGEIHKNWVLFPEKINGKFAILHSISPNVMVDYRETLEDIGSKEPHIKSPVGPRSAKRENDWDWLIRGVGCPPIKTEKGWLVLYHAIEKHEGDKYKVGVLLLDLNDPSKVIARSPGPLLSPHCWYENDGKPGIVYTCGAVVRDGLLVVYYGGGDMHTCTAQAPLKDVLAWLVSTEK